jgi:hypothetical protein
MKTHKLLTFNDDYADEHNVPALAVMTEQEYQKWLKTPSGKKVAGYDEKKALYDANEKLSSDFWKALKDAGITNTSLIPKDRPDLINLEEAYRKSYKYMRHPNKVKSFLRANLGNGGECFDEGYSNYYLFEEFVAAGIVEVFDVTEEFAKTFKKTNLEDLSLCNVFDLEDLSDYDDEDDDEDEDDE